MPTKIVWWLSTINIGVVEHPFTDGCLGTSLPLLIDCAPDLLDPALPLVFLSPLLPTHVPLVWESNILALDHVETGISDPVFKTITFGFSEQNRLKFDDGCHATGPLIMFWP